MKKYSLLFLACALLVCCKKKVETVVVPNNVPTTDTSVSTLTIERFVIKTYVVLFARKPTEAELQNHLTTLTSNNIAQAARINFIQQLQNTNEYKFMLYEFAKQKIIDPLGTLNDSGYQNSRLIQEIKDNIAAQNEPKLNTELLGAMYKFRTMKTELLNNTITWQEVNKRCCHSFYYYGDNLGSREFVLHTFEHLLQRIPTKQESDAGRAIFISSKNAVETPDVLFGVTGKSISDLLDIIVTSDNFYEAQVRYFYVRSFYKEPETLVLSKYTNVYTTSKDYQLLQRTILSSNEFLQN